MTVVLPLTRRWKISAENSAIDSVFGHFLEVEHFVFFPTFGVILRSAAAALCFSLPKVSRIRTAQKIYMAHDLKSNRLR